MWGAQGGCEPVSTMLRAGYGGFSTGKISLISLLEVGMVAEMEKHGLMIKSKVVEVEQPLSKIH